MLNVVPARRAAAATENVPSLQARRRKAFKRTTTKMGDIDSIELDIWQGEWGLPSIDASCLAVMAYCKFSSVPLTVIKANNPWKSPTGELPVLRHGGTTDNKGVISKVPDIITYLRKQSLGTDFDLTLKQSADLVAFTSMIDEKLVPALLHLWWVDTKTYAELTRPQYAKLLPFPLNYYVPIRKHKETEQRLLYTRGGDNMSNDDRQAQIYRDAKECLNMLSSKLGDQSYFFGNKPTSLDAIVFGHLGPLLKAPIQNTALQNHLKGCVNLCQFIFRIISTYFPQTPQEEEAERKKAEEEKQKATSSSDFPNQRRNMMVSGMVALTAMVGYAFINGLVNVEFSDGENNSAPAALPNFNQFDKFVDDEESGEKQKGGDRGGGGGQKDEEGNQKE